MTLIPYLERLCGIRSMPMFDHYLMTKINPHDDCKYITFLRQSSNDDDDYDPIEIVYKIQSDGITVSPFHNHDLDGRPVLEDPYTRELIDCYIQYLQQTGDFEGGVNSYIENAFFQYHHAWESSTYETCQWKIENRDFQDNNQRYLLTLSGQYQGHDIKEHGSIIRRNNSFYGYFGSNYRRPDPLGHTDLDTRKQILYDYKLLTSAFWHDVIEPLHQHYKELLEHPLITPEWTLQQWQSIAQQLKQTDISMLAVLLPYEPITSASWFEEIYQWVHTPPRLTETTLHLG